ncbi:MAG: hypothetical protein WDN28_31245 [Chthoniobacter sp.]
MLVQGELEPPRRRGAEQVEHLLDVQVVADRHALQSLAHEIGGGQRVRDIERKIPDELERPIYTCSGGVAFREIRDRPEVADEHTVRRGIFD